MIEIYGILFTLGLGAFLPFIYEWSGRSLLICLLAPTNTSVFERLKLLLTPFLIWSLNEYVHYGQFTKNFIPAKTLGLFAGILFIVLTFYGYAAICNRDFLPVDVILFTAAVLIAFGTGHALMQVDFLTCFLVKFLSYICLAILTLTFIICSICPPQGSLFRSSFPSRHKTPCK